MRVVLANTRHFPGGGDSTYTFNLAELLHAKGHEVAFFAMQDPRNLPDPNADLFVSPIAFRELAQHKSVAGGLRVLGRVIYSREAQAKFSLLLDRFQPDVVHLQNIHGHITPSIIFEAKRRGLPVVWTLHDYKQVCPNTHFMVDHSGALCEACAGGRYYHALLKRCKKGSRLASGMAALEAYAHRFMRVRARVDAFLAPSTFLRAKLIAGGLAPENVHHLPLFLRPSQFHEGSESKEYLLFLGRLEPFKGIRPLLQACREAPGVTLLLAGSVGETLASELAGLLPPNARHLGFRQGEALQRLLAQAQAVVVPSLWYENQPFSILEAFACGKPVIASALGGMRELVGDGERGLLVPAGDVGALARAMRWMVEHPREAEAKGQRAQAYAHQAHGAETHYATLLAIYRGLVPAQRRLYQATAAI